MFVKPREVYRPQKYRKYLLNGINGRFYCAHIRCLGAGETAG
jgi:hypothetical protein